MTTVSSQIMVKVPAAQAYRAFTNATALREWMCDVASVTPRPRGRIYLWWNGDFYSSGHFLALEENRMVRFHWFSSIDPGPSEITVTFAEASGSTHVCMEHTVPDGADWEQRAQGFRAEWDSTLENLKSVLETGIDQRIANRPMLGFFPGDFTPEQADKLGVPVNEGLRLDGVLEGMGAAAAGLQKDDVIVSIDGNTIGNDFQSFLNAIQGKKGGDNIEATYFRGPVKKVVQMTLSKRPMAEVPFDAAELVRQGKPKYEAALAELNKCFAGVSDAQAARRASAKDWSAMDTLAHLLQNERGAQFFIAECLSGYERWADDYGVNEDAPLRAIVETYPTVQALLAELSRSVAETLSLVANLPADFVANKGSFYRVGNLILNGDIHFYSHIDQIKSALAAAKS
jgi:uncharacterized protein YndB with AHSA1/START domain